MNFLKKSIFAGILPCAVASGQGLYSIAPNDDEASSSLPLTYIVGASLGYDDNPTPLTDSDEGSLYASGFVQANWTSVTPQTTWDVFARLGVRYYFDDFESSDADSTNFDARVGVNFTHRFSERLRFSSRNLLAYEQEPDYDYGLSNDRRTGDYFRYSSDNSVGYRWSDRLGTQTGIQFSGVRYQDLDNSDYSQIAFRHDFRYRMSPATVVTAGYKYALVDRDLGGDATSHYITGGVEHRISPESAIVLRAGAQITDPDNGDSRTRPFLEAALKSSLTSQLSTNLFVRYSNESWNQSLLSDNGRQTFEQSQTFRLGGKATYALNPQVSLFGGVNYILTNYDDQIFGADGDGSESLLNLNVGGSYQLSSNLYLTGSYNFTTSISDFDGRDYDRNRFQLGVQGHSNKFVEQI